jgi:hypothetical protein
MTVKSTRKEQLQNLGNPESVCVPFKVFHYQRLKKTQEHGLGHLLDYSARELSGIAPRTGSNQQ